MKLSDTLDDWLDYLKKTRFFHFDDARDGNEDLQYAKKIVEQLHLNPFRCPVITVTGTNGKGSCIAAMESILLAAGYSVGAISSPHLLTFTDRLRLNGKNIDEAELCTAFLFIAEQEKKLNWQLSYFRFIHTAMIYLVSQEKVDVALFEIGLGGRSDSINLIDPSISVITSISLDHCEILGNTREKIAHEKSGIFRENTPVVCGEEDGAILFKQPLNALHCDYYQFGQAFKVVKHDSAWSFQNTSLHFTNLPHPKIMLRNAAIALQALSLLPSSFRLKEASVVEGLRKIHLLGRQDYIQASVPCLLDVSHNPASVSALFNKIKELSVLGKKYAIFNVRQGKDMVSMLTTMLPIIDDWYIPPMDHPAAKRPSEVVEYLLNAGKQARVCSSVDAAYKAIESVAKETDLVVVFGSFDIVSAMYRVVG